ncbi:hypothetical protein [Escherichia coli]
MHAVTQQNNAILNRRGRERGQQVQRINPGQSRPA